MKKIVTVVLLTLLTAVLLSGCQLIKRMVQIILHKVKKKVPTRTRKKLW